MGATLSFGPHSCVESLPCGGRIDLTFVCNSLAGSTVAASLHTVVGNLSGSPRHETLHGRQYLVVPLTLIVEGVLNGSQGRIYYPAEELARDPSVWNGMPLVLRHPSENGQPLSARDPRVLQNSYLGMVYRASYNSPRLQAEGWFDRALLQANYQALYVRINRGEPIELSTGLYLDAQQAPNGATFNQTSYDWIGRNYRPDHVAILPDETGACPVTAGCGVNVNSGGVPVQKTELITWLTANCACWKGSEAALNALTDHQLTVLKSEAEQSTLFRNVLNKGFKHKGRSYKYDQAKGGIVVNSLDGAANAADAEDVKEDNTKNMCDDPEDKTKNANPQAVSPAPATASNAPAPGAVSAVTGLNASKDNVANRLTTDEQEDLRWAREERTRQKQAVASRLVGHVANDAERARLYNNLMAKGLAELNDLSSLMAANTPQPAQNAQPAYVPSYVGAAVPERVQAVVENRDDYLPVSTMDWEEIAGLPNKRK